MKDFRSQTEIARRFRQSLASGDGVLDQVSKQSRHIKLTKEHGFRKFNIPVYVDTCGDCQIMVVAKESVQSRI